MIVSFRFYFDNPNLGHAERFEMTAPSEDLLRQLSEEFDEIYHEYEFNFDEARRDVLAWFRREFDATATIERV